MRVLLILPLVMAVAACQLALPGVGKGPAASQGGNPITGDEILVTSLDAPAETATAEVEGTPDSSGATQSDGTTNNIAEGSPTSAESTAKETIPEAPPEATPAASPEAEPVIKSPARLACEKKRGVWSNAGSSSASFCQTPTRDGGKSCSKSTDCEGYCLAKSGTCAPITPLFGCNDILTEEGRLITQCIN